jgi:arabinose-5-phosphate isomerase
MISAARTAGQDAGGDETARGAVGGASGAAASGGASPQALELARRVLAIEADAVRALIARLDERFLAAVSMILGCKGRVIVSGIGKSGHVARKIASTMASTGTPAYFVHPAEASHGDLGMIQRDDVFIAISHSGESDELLAIVPLVKRQGAKFVAVTGSSGSSLAREADVHLDAGVAQEACPLNLAPTASTTAALALGDALAVALLDARGFSAEDFARSHPGGKLGRRLLTHVSDVMRTGEAVPAVSLSATLADAIIEISRKGMGMTAIVDAERRVIGIFTDGDLRRSLERNADPHRTRIEAVMTRNPRVIRPEALAVEAVETMERCKSTQLPVVDGGGRLVGALNIHDLFRAKVI